MIISGTYTYIHGESYLMLFFIYICISPVGFNKRTLHVAATSDTAYKLCSDPDETQPCSGSFWGPYWFDLFRLVPLSLACRKLIPFPPPPRRHYTALVCAVLLHTRILSANIVDFITTLYSNHTKAVVKAPLRSGRQQTAAARENTTHRLSVCHRGPGSTCGQPSPQSTRRGELKKSGVFYPGARERSNMSQVEKSLVLHSKTLDLGYIWLHCGSCIYFT